ncbi:NAD(P)-binding protein [Piscinibacter sp.]|uniref:NAD(P)-binding protein n=1 Tax=Piscinibacter sp. TaxID=1903157 RepID=UPI002CAB3CFC|nr:NAD(P)-binding protein [Albitalea sp.]HUG20904.1 NAD(P)-binding protein [Albitalea sp.]
MPQRPDFLYPGGSPLMHPTLQLKQSEMYGFFVRGDMARLQSTVDGTLTAVARSKMSFKVLSPFVMLTFTRVNHANSAWPTDRAKGWGTEIDIVTWIMVGQVLNGESRVSDVFFYPCHIFVDDCMALINGRELFGYPKYQCEYTMPAAGEPAAHFTLAAKGFQPFSPETPLAVHPLLEVNATTRSGSCKELDGLEDFIEEALQLMAANLPAFLDLDRDGWDEVVQMLRGMQVEQIFLKQFPDAAGIKAVYQAVVTAPAKVTAIRQVQLLGDEYECVLHPFASFPLNDTLGLALGAQEAILPFHISLDFEVTAGRELVDNSVVAPEKIAILGGGVAAMTAAFYLTDQPGWQNEREVTVYQMGWRLGGKGASGRNAALGQRIEEHGLHIWFGFYDNAFKTIQRAYELLDRPEGAPLRTWQDAFKEQHFITLTEFVNGQCRLWPIDTPIMPGQPGSGDEKLNLWRVALTAYEWIKQWIETLRTEHAPPAAPRAAPEPGVAGWLSGLVERVEDRIEDLTSDVSACLEALHTGVRALAAELNDDTDQAAQAAALQALREWARRSFAERAEAAGVADELRRLYICVDLALTSLIGMYEDGVFTEGFDVINDEDFYAWLTRHGANPKLTVHSAPVRGFYDLVFAYENGDFDKPNIEAGTMLRGMMRVALDYHGAIMWKMQAGMGDVVFAPFYEVLKRRGVKFEFFHKVEELVPDTDDAVGEIRLTRQVDLAPGVASYDPLVDVKGLPCWPSTPNYDQIAPEQAALLQEGRVNLESNWSDWPQRYAQAFGKPLPVVALKRGVDFDKVVFGISVAGVEALCPQLVARSPALAACTQHVKAVATQAYQTWSIPRLPQLGWTEYGRDGQAPVLSGFSEPFDTWAPMDQLLSREDWPPAAAPGNVSYFCSALPITDYPPASDHGFPERMARQVKESAIAQLNQAIFPLWPKVATPQGFDWSALYDPAGGVDVHRFDSQYWRANVDPSERYVLSLVGSSHFRIEADGTGFRNLFVTGDWIRTGLNAGCVEAATMAGMQASRAICGHPAAVVGDHDV